jgi:hypothetical protein
MRVSEAIKLLNTYKPDDDIYIEWWSKEMFDHDTDNPVLDDDWREAVKQVATFPDEWAIGTLFDQLETALYNVKRARVGA